ncbi:MAG: hypothetical protein NkDv07_0573 [Candidatus Improbicoccus devescovinae]|nr:MAG: hypothetical protein NkDv07_0573 [Candidatus Improbicoccus devescovinae]
MGAFIYKQRISPSPTNQQQPTPSPPPPPQVQSITPEQPDPPNHPGFAISTYKSMLCRPYSNNEIKNAIETAKARWEEYNKSPKDKYGCSPTFFSAATAMREMEAAILSIPDKEIIRNDDFKRKYAMVAIESSVISDAGSSQVITRRFVLMKLLGYLQQVKFRLDQILEKIQILKINIDVVKMEKLQEFQKFLDDLIKEIIKNPSKPSDLTISDELMSIFDLEFLDPGYSRGYHRILNLEVHKPYMIVSSERLDRMLNGCACVVADGDDGHGLISNICSCILDTKLPNLKLDKIPPSVQFENPFRDNF